MKNRVTIFMITLFLCQTSFLYTSDEAALPKPDIVIEIDAVSTAPLFGTSKDDDSGFMSDLDISDKGFKGDDGSIKKEEEGFAFLAKKMSGVSLQPKKIMSKDAMLKKYLVSVRAAAGPKKSETFEIGEPQPKMLSSNIKHVGPKAKGNLAILGVQRRNMEKSYPGLFWDKRK